MEYKTDPKLIGPGIWQIIHLKAKLAIDNQTKKHFIDEMYFHYNNFPCANCRKHIQEYMDSHSFEPFYDMKNNTGTEIGMFKWSWMFHNAVNTRLQKPYLDWNTACEMYQINETVFKPCTNCGEKSPMDKNKIVQGYFLKRNSSFY